MKHWKVKIPGKEGRLLLHHAGLVQALSDHFLLFPTFNLTYYYGKKIMYNWNYL